MAGAFIFTGVIDLFSFIDYGVTVYTAAFMDMVSMAIALALMYLFVIKPIFKTNKAKQAYVSTTANVFFIYQALTTLLPCITVVLIYAYKNNPQFAELFQEYVYAEQDLIPCIIGISIYAAMVISYLIISYILKRTKNNEPEYSEESTIKYNEPNPFNKSTEYDPFESIDDWGNDTSETQNDDNIDNNNSGDIW